MISRQQPQQAQHRLQHGHGDAVDIHAPRCRRVGLGGQLLVANQLADVVQRQFQPQPQVGFVVAGHAHLAAHRQVDRGHQVVHGVVHIDVVAHDDALGALRDQPQRRGREGVLGAFGLADAEHMQAGHGGDDGAVLPAHDVLEQRHQFLAGFVDLGFERHGLGRLADHGVDGGCFVGHVQGLVAMGAARRPWRNERFAA